MASSSNGVPDSSNVVAMYKSVLEDIDAINKLFVESKLDSKVLTNIITINNKVLRPTLNSIRNINKGLVEVVMSIKAVDKYIVDNEKDFEGLKYLSGLIGNLSGVLSLTAGGSGSIAALSDDAFDSTYTNLLVILSHIRYIAIAALSTGKMINEGLDALVGDSTSYEELMSERPVRKGKSTNNTSLLYRYFLINKILTMCIDSFGNKMMGPIKRFFLFNFKIKGSIKLMFDTLNYMITKSNKMKKITAGFPEQAKELVSNTVSGMTEFLMLLDIIGNKKWGIVERIKIKKNIKGLWKIFKYFIKLFVKKLSNKMQKWIKPAFKNVDKLKELIFSLHMTLQMFEMLQKYNIFKIWRYMRRLKMIFRKLVEIPAEITDTTDFSRIEDARVATDQILEILRNVLVAIEIISQYNIKKRKIKKIRRLFGFIDEVIAKLAEYAKKKLDNKIKTIYDVIIIFESIKKIVAISAIIGTIGPIVLIGTWISIKLLDEIIVAVNKVKITKKTLEKVNNLTEILNKINEPIIKFMGVMALMAAIGTAALIGIAITIGALFSFIFSFVFISNKVGNKKTLEKIDNFISLFDKITKSLLLFGAILAMAGTFGTTVLIGAGILLGSIGVFVFGYYGLAEFLTRKNVIRKIKKSERMLVSMSTITLTFAQAIKETAKALVLTSIFIILLSISIYVFAYVRLSSIINKNRGKIKRALKTLTKMAISLLSFAQSMKLLSKDINPKIMLAVLILGAVILEIVLILILIKFVSKSIKKALRILLYITLALLMFFIAIGLISLLAITIAIPTLIAIGLMVLLVGILFLIGVFKSQILWGGIVLVLIGVALLIFGYAIQMFVQAISGLLENNYWLWATIAIMALVGICIILGIPPISEFAAIGAIILILISSSLLVFAMGLLLMSVALKQIDSALFKDFSISFMIIIGMFAMAAGAMALIILGSISFTLIGASLIPFAFGILAVNLALTTINPEFFDKFVDVMNRVIMVYTIAGLGMLFLVLGAVAMTLVGASLLPFALGILAVNLVLKTVNPEEFTDKLLPIVKCLGKIFVAAALLAVFAVPGTIALLLVSSSLLPFALSLILTWKALEKIEADVFKEKMKTILSAISDTLKMVKDMDIGFKAMGALFKLQFVAMALAGLAMTIALIARLQIADEWNEQGKPIHYTRLTEQDFIDAGNSAKRIATDLLNIVAGLNISGELEDKIEDAEDVFESLQPVILGLAGMAEIVSKLATLQIADEWNSDGNPVHFRKITEDEINKASMNAAELASSIIGCFGSEEIRKMVKKMDEDDNEVISGLFSAVSNISTVADIVAKLATLMVPNKWDDNGKPIGYERITDSQLTTATDNVVKLVSVILSSLSSSGMTDIISKFDKEGAETFGTVLEAVGKISSVVDLVVRLAEGSYVVEFDEKTGKPKKYGKFDELLGGEGASKISNNIVTILDCVIKGLSTALGTYKEYDLKALGDKINNIKDIADPIGKSIDTIVKINENKAFKNFKADEYEVKIRGIMTAILSPFKDDAIFSAGDAENIKNKLSTVDRCVDVIKKVSDIEAAKFVGNIEKTTKATNAFLTKLQSIDTVKLDKMALISDNMQRFAASINGNFDGLAKALNEKIVTAVEELNATIEKLNEVLEGVNTSLEGASTTLTAAVQNTGSTENSGSTDENTTKLMNSVNTQIKNLNTLLSITGIKVKSIDSTVPTYIVKNV